MHGDHVPSANHVRHKSRRRISDKFRPRGEMHHVRNDRRVVVGTRRDFRIVRVEIFVVGTLSFDKKLGQNAG